VLTIFDTTLRDGEQSPGATLSLGENPVLPLPSLAERRRYFTECEYQGAAESERKSVSWLLSPVRVHKAGY
jgi:isopropylmalate/homocitrate/citramalate synthase